MKQIRLTGSGGQGIITIAIILAEAAVAQGKQVVQTQSYGPEARGGSSKAEVIISHKPISYPKVTHPDLVLAMTQESSDQYTKDLSENDMVVIDTTFVQQMPDTSAKVIAAPITQTARDQLGRELFSNIIALGLIGKVSGLVEKEILQQAVLARVPKGTEEKNIQAFELGWNLQ